MLIRLHLLFSVLLKLFVKSNQGDEETTKINYLTFIGTPVQATNMNDFRRVCAGFSSRFIFMFVFFWYFCSPDCVKHTVILNGCCCSGCGEDRRESLSRRRMRRSGGWKCVQGPSVRTFCLPKLPHTLLSHSLQLTSGSKWIMSVEGQSINHLYCKSAENYCK